MPPHQGRDDLRVVRISRSVVRTWRATLRRCHRTWRATLRRCHLEGNAPSLPPHLEGNAPSLPPQGRDDLHVVRTWRATLRRCHRKGGMTSASSASVAPSSPALAPLVCPTPALAALVWSIPSLHRPGYSCHAISKSRSPASSALPVVRRAAHKWAPGTPPFASLRPSAISALSRYVRFALQSASTCTSPAAHDCPGCFTYACAASRQSTS